MVEDEKGYTDELWKKMSELGFMGLLVPEQYGGTGGSFLDMAVLLYEMGYACLPGPFFSTAVLGPLTLLEAASDAQKTELLPGIASGEKIATLAWTEQAGTYTPEGIALKADAQGDQYLLTGTKLFVPDAGVADVLICAGLTGAPGASWEEGVSLFLVDAKSPGISVNPLKTIAGDKQFEVIFDGVRVPAANLLGEANRGGEVLQTVLLKAAVAKAAEMSGAAQKALDMVVQYSKERKQFGVFIGSFQAIQHHCANMLTYVETAQWLMYQAAWRISDDLSYKKEASMAKAWVSEACRKTLALGHQVVGGMAFMEEHDLPLYFRRAKAAEVAFGDADFHRELVAQEMQL
jgi:alkylation response protein AidB-like acyl-CoA dehydrogenase